MQDTYKSTLTQGEAQGGMRWTFTVRLEPQVYQYEMDRGTLIREGDRHGDDAIRSLIWDQSRGFAVAAYEAVLGAAAAAVGATGFDISAEMMQSIVQEDQRREIAQLLNQVETLGDENAKLEARLDEHRRFIGRHALEIVSDPRINPEKERTAIRLEERAGVISAEEASERIAATYEEPYVSRQQRAAMRETADIPTFHELLLLGDQKYKAAVDWAGKHGIVAKATDQAGRDFIVSAVHERGGD